MTDRSDYLHGDPRKILGRQVHVHREAVRSARPQRSHGHASPGAGLEARQGLSAAHQGGRRGSHGARQLSRGLVTDPAASSDEVFINCPFDPDYAPFFHALIFCVYACGFRVRSSKELEDSAEGRMDKLYRIIGQCRYGIHDISRTELDDNGLPRFNMPFELGLFLGARRYGGKDQKTKRALILDREPYRYQKFISDLAGMDPKSHDGDVETAIERTRDWLRSVSRRNLPAGPQVIALHRKFTAQLPVIAAGIGFDAARIPYSDFERIITDWLVSQK